MEVVGLHLLQSLDLVDSPRRSAVALVDAVGVLRDLRLVASDEEILDAVPPGAAAVVVDAPLAVPNESGRRDVEEVLAWCDHTAFPVSRRRLTRVHGGARGVALAARLAAPGRRVTEALPDLVLRQLEWERMHPPGAPPLDLADYRVAWLGVRAPAYRPRGRGRARPEGVRAAWRLLSGGLDLGGWAPGDAGGEWGAVHDAARLDALCCAVAGRRALGADPAGGVVLGTPERGEVVAPADANLRRRLALNLDRLRAEGAVRI